MVKSSTFFRYAAASLLVFVALCAFGGVFYGLSGARDVPIEWLAGSPFSTYFIPSLILFAVVGGSAVIAAVSLFLKIQWSSNAAFIAAAIQLGWIGVQVAVIGYVSWLQPAVAAYAVITLALATLIPAD